MMMHLSSANNFITLLTFLLAPDAHPPE